MPGLRRGHRRDALRVADSGRPARGAAGGAAVHLEVVTARGVGAVCKAGMRCRHPAHRRSRTTPSATSTRSATSLVQDPGSSAQPRPMAGEIRAHPYPGVSSRTWASSRTAVRVAPKNAQERGATPAEGVDEPVGHERGKGRTRGVFAARFGWQFRLAVKIRPPKRLPN